MSGRGRGRGRGRGAARGRGGRGRSRSGGRGRGHGRRGGHGGRGATSSNNAGYEDWNNLDIIDTGSNQDEKMDINGDVKKFFVGTASFDHHYEAQNTNKNRYVAGMVVLTKNGVEISQNAKVRGLAAAWSRNDHNLADSFLSNRKQFGLVEVLKALTLLDSARRIRVQEKKMKRLQMQTGGKLKPKVIGRFKRDIDNLTAIKPKHGSASGAVCRHIRRWVQHFTKEELEFYALHFPADPWKQLADICHFNPQKDFSSLNWFLPFCYGEPAPEGTLVRHCKEVNAENVNELLKEFRMPYTHIKSLHEHLNDASKAKIASYDDLDRILWYYEELKCEEVDNILKQRLEEGEKVDLPYGKLMERLLTIKMLCENISTKRSYRWGDTDKTEVQRNVNPNKATFYKDLIPLAERKLKEIKLPLEQPIVVIGDRSGSMEVAIRTATIIASLLTAITKARLVFFDHENMEAPFVPTNIEEVLEMAVQIHTRGSTIPAASLMPFYEKKEIVKTFVVVTDEGENGKCENYYFSELFEKYMKEVYNARLVFVSFLRQNDKGLMVPKLRDIGANIMQFKFDPNRPDLTKLDNLFGLLSSESQENFEEQVTRMQVEVAAEGVQKVLEKMSIDEKDSGTKTSASVTHSGDITSSSIMTALNNATRGNSSTTAETNLPMPGLTVADVPVHAAATSGTENTAGHDKSS